ncbi:MULTISPECIES: 3-carboxyethylcatechol 2,3-dioxygenase [unclassified Nocardioides]|uniref:3-carboxyethylcatechol 2,3-dioxygenase n=1 Tax=unclassified Nocardioides TaxID=2615069 RepID=UPI0009EFF59A|nr:MULTISPECIES: 3-carboxyethylcatechol 2,3-dioxygenase [unclassified Nocardioides]GAW48960.1 OhpD protein [Nocardioides sp. PD653-B2]GAW55175.1 OhpD protein [Nocardioides sp. PD653]
MPAALVGTSHTPLLGKHDPRPEVRAEVDGVLASARAFVEDFAPDLVVIFGPDHYNGFLYDMMPSFCIGAEATSVGDYGMPTGPLEVDRGVARRILRHALESGIDLALSEDMQVDHGIVQPLTFFFDAIHSIPVVPIFINSVAEPLGPAIRARLLGRAVGEALSGLDRRVLIIGSGGLSHDPPVLRFDESTPEVIERLKHGRNPSPEQMAAREKNVIGAAREFFAGSPKYRPLNPEWDRRVLDSLAAADFAAIDQHNNDWFVAEGGHSAHEVRTWIAAYAALAAFGDYAVTSTYYRPIPEWFAGFATTTAVLQSAASI